MRSVDPRGLWQSVDNYTCTIPVLITPVVYLYTVYIVACSRTERSTVDRCPMARINNGHGYLSQFRVMGPHKTQPVLLSQHHGTSVPQGAQQQHIGTVVYTRKYSIGLGKVATPNLVEIN